MVQPVILHIETSSLACSVALSRGEELLAWQTQTERYVHSAALAPITRDILQSAGLVPADLQAIAVSIGPGSYTGLRVGLSFAKGLCTVLSCPLIAVDTLQSLAVTAARRGEPVADIYISTLDARRQDAYLAVFDSTGVRLAENRFVTVEPVLLQPWMSGGRQVVVCGEGTAKWAADVHGERARIAEIPCDARNLVPVAAQLFENQQFADVESVVPAYLKPPNITIPAQ